jgi:hypothetical protein
MGKGEDVIITFFYKTDDNNPQDLVEYHVWYNQEALLFKKGFYLYRFR